MGFSVPNNYQPASGVGSSSTGVNSAKGKGIVKDEDDANAFAHVSLSNKQMMINFLYKDLCKDYNRINQLLYQVKCLKASANSKYLVFQSLKELSCPFSALCIEFLHSEMSRDINHLNELLALISDTQAAMKLKDGVINGIFGSIRLLHLF